MRLSNSHKSWLEDATAKYHAALTEETRSYLEHRGLDKTAVDGARLGLVHEPEPAHAQFEGRLAIPFITPTGVVYMRFRCLADHDCKDFSHGKYEGPAATDTHLYNVSSLHVAERTVAICEGELDALVCTLAGLPAVGVPGANNWKPFYYRLFDDYGRVIVIGDGDTAGRTFSATLAGNIPSAIPCPMPTGHDVSSYVVEHGAEKFLELVKGSQ